MKLGLPARCFKRVALTIITIILLATLAASAPSGAAATAESSSKTPDSSAALLLTQAQAYRTQGEYADAERLYQQVLAMPGAGLEVEISAHKGLALVYQATRRQRQAFDEQTSAMSFEQELMTEQAERSAAGSESSLRAATANFADSLEVLVSMAAEDVKLPELKAPLGPPIAGVTQTIPSETLGWVLLRKGIILDTIKQGRWLGQADAREVRAVRELRQQLSQLELNPPPGLDETQRAKLKKDLQDKLDATEGVIALENEMHPQSGAAVDAPLRAGDLFRWSGEPETERSFRSAAVPTHTALIEFLRARVFDFQAAATMPAWKPAHYYAFILAGGEVRSAEMVDLGDAGAIEAAIKEVRRNILQFSAVYVTGRAGTAYERQKEAEFRKRSKTLCNLVFAPLRPALGAVRLLYLAPDGELNRVAFEAFVEERPGHKPAYLVEDYRFTYLSSGRDIASDPASPGQGTVVIANPDYDLGAAKRQKLVAALRGPRPASQVRGGMASFASETVAYQPWSRLPGSAREAELVGRELVGTRYGPVEVYADDQALEERLLDLQSPRILHIATHGFFLPDEPLNPQEVPTAAGTNSQAHSLRSEVSRSGAAAPNAAAAEDPLMRSGILLAGANTLGRQLGASVGTGWVTSEEIMSMDLQGTELVVLSGCDTGLGDIQTGEGVLGLRRAFLYAGARSLLVSLYSVPDQETIRFMSHFYESLKGGAGKLDSFHDAELAVLLAKRRQTGIAHPFYWASFILVGDPN
jgi:CHAT domain-containing protein